jgi:ribosomal protein S11
MILSSIINDNKKVYVYQLKKITKVLKKFKNVKKGVDSNKTFKLQRNKINQSLVMYVINVVLSPTNTYVNVVDLKGNVLISISAGSLNLTKFQKKTQPMALLSVFKVLFLKAKFLVNKPVALHFKNVKRFHESFFINALKTKLYIKSFQSYNLVPHNGCRPKKLKKIKVRTKRLVLR